MSETQRISAITNIISRFNLRFPTLFLILGILTLIDVFTPDFIPFLDEIGLAILTALFALWKKRRVKHYQESAE